MLTLVVGSAPAVDPIACNCRVPWIEIVAPLPDHAVDDVAMSVHQNRGRRSALAVFGEQVRMLSGRGFDQSCRKIELRKCRLKVFREVGAQSALLFGVLAF